MVTDLKNTAKLKKERQSHAATADTSKLSSLPLSALSVDDSRPPTVLQGLYMALSTSTPIHVQQDSQSLQQSLYPSLAALGPSTNIAVSPLIPFSR